MEPLDLAIRWITHAKETSGLSWGEIARRSGYARSYISRVVHRRIPHPSVNMIIEIVEACGFEVVELRVRKKSGESQPVSQAPGD